MLRIMPTRRWLKYFSKLGPLSLVYHLVVGASTSPRGGSDLPMRSLMNTREKPNACSFSSTPNRRRRKSRRPNYLRLHCLNPNNRLPSWSHLPLFVIDLRALLQLPRRPKLSLRQKTHARCRDRLRSWTPDIAATYHPQPQLGIIPLNPRQGIHPRLMLPMLTASTLTLKGVPPLDPRPNIEGSPTSGRVMSRARQCLNHLSVSRLPHRRRSISGRTACGV